MSRIFTAVVAAAILALGGSLIAQSSVPEIAFDTNADLLKTPGDVYVGDRGNQRVQVLDNDLNWKANYTNVGNPWAVCVSGGPGPKNPGKQYLYVSNSWPDSAPAGPAEFTGEVYKMELDGTIIGKFGRAGKAAGQFATIHQMDCRDPDVIYTAEINNWRSQKILLKPQATKPTSQE